MSLAHPLRRRVFRGPRELGVALLTDAPFIHVATTTPDGTPVLRAVNAVVDDDVVAFHGAPAGEKLLTLGRSCVVSADDHVAQIPSHFVDAERACPATTYFRSVQVHGTLDRIDDLDRKARILARLMAKHQPEGRHVPISAQHPLYAKELAAILVVGVSLAHLEVKNKLGQNRSPEDVGRILAGLWTRGDRGDMRAIELVREANPEAQLPAVLEAGAGYRLAVAEECPDDWAKEAASLLEGAYWLGGTDGASVAASHRASAAAVGVRDDRGDLVASARALSDRRRTAWIYDVVVRPDHRGRGLGKLLVERLLEHPVLRETRFVRLGTRDAQGLYARFGFEACGVTPTGATEMVLRRLGDRSEPSLESAQNGTGPASVQR